VDQSVRERVRRIPATPYQVGARVADGELVFGGNVEPLVPFEVHRKTMIAMEARERAPNPAGPRGYRSRAAMCAVGHVVVPCTPGTLTPQPPSPR
jgi:hypothetical protein